MAAQEQDDDRKSIIAEFNEAVNMTPGESEKKAPPRMPPGTSSR